MEEIIALRHRLHRAAELSMQESETKEILMDFLRKEEKLQITDRGRWFYACCPSGVTGAPAIAFRADMDALPMEDLQDLPYRSRNAGVSHRCGHDGHCAALAGFARRAARMGLKADLYFIFQHAEEIGAGAGECAGLIREKGIGRIYAFHNWSGFSENSVAVKEDIVQCASGGLTIHFIGKSAHASQPEDGRNPVQALAKLAQDIDRFLKETPWKGMTMATIVHMQAGAKDFGIAASRGEISMTLRSFHDEDMQTLHAGILARAAELARQEGLLWETEESDVFPATVNDGEETRRVVKIAGEMGLKVVHMDAPFRSSEDFGYYQQACPGVIFYIGNGETWPQIHTEGYDFNDRILPTAIELFERIARTNEK